MPDAHALLVRVPEPWRRWLTLRRVRRWLAAVRFERRHNRALPADAPAVCFYPMRLGPTAALAHVLNRLGWRIAELDMPAAATIAWETGTVLPLAAAARLPASAVNRACIDVSKDLVDRVWAQVAGYSIAVDPLTTRGPLVVKPLENSVRGGRIVAGPLHSRRAGVVYQKLVDCRIDGRIHTLRPVLFGGQILLVYEKWRAATDWFNGPEEVAVRRPDETLSASEQDQVLRFAQAIGLDYGELDVLRDSSTGLIYVVDANRTPIRPRGLAAVDEDAAFGPLADALRSHIGRQAG